MSVARRWLAMMVQGESDAATQYDLRGEPELLRTAQGVPTSSFGYWQDVATNAPDALYKATEAAFRRVGERAELGPSDALVLDAGCGFGTNARYLVEHFGVKRVVGLNISAFQLGRCEELAAKAKLTERLEFRHGSATAMPFPDASFDKIVSVEAAFHFSPRRQFFKEALRVLKPGGILSLVDLVVTPAAGPLQELHLGLLKRAVQIPGCNVYGIEKYRSEVLAAGLTVRELSSIRQHVVPPYFRWLCRQPVRKLLGVGWSVVLSSGSFFFYPWDYVGLTAYKPSAG